MAVSDVVASTELPEEMLNDPVLYARCIAGAPLLDDLHAMFHAAGFQDIRVAPKDESREFIKDWAPGRGVEEYVLSAHIEATKPALPG